MTKAAEEGRLDPVVGREKEIERIAQILSRRKKKQPDPHRRAGRGKVGYRRRAGTAHRRKEGVAHPVRKNVSSRLT